MARRSASLIEPSHNTFDSGDGHKTSGYSNHGVARPGAVVKAFEDATKPGMCTGAILRARINAAHPENTIEPFSWGYRNPFGIRFAPHDHALKGGLFVTENGEDERGARPTNFAPDRLHLARQHKNGKPDYHGWPDRFGFLESTQAVFTVLFADLKGSMEMLQRRRFTLSTAIDRFLRRNAARD